MADRSRSEPRAEPESEPKARWRRGAEGLVVFLLFGGIVFGPWALGTTQPGTVAVLSAAGVVLGLVAGGLRWRDLRAGGTGSDPEGGARRVRWLGVLTVIGLGYQLVAILNARSDFDPRSLAFLPRPHVDWLPGSYDRGASWRVFWGNVGLAGTFWATRWWLRGAGADGSGRWVLRSRRARRLLMLITTNAFLVAVVALLQRLDDTGRLLWLVEPRINRTAAAQFGPFAYRGNGLQYLALAWPLALALWSILTLARREPAVVGTGRRGWALAAAATMAACPFLWESRLAWAVGAGSLLAAIGLLAAVHRARRGWWLAALGVGLAAGLAVVSNWEGLAGRVGRSGWDSAERWRVLEVGGRMGREHWVWGTGPGTFGSLYPLYRADVSAAWQVQMHCDWLQCLVENGVVGGLIVGLFFAGIASVAAGRRGRWPEGEAGLVGLVGLGLVATLAGGLLDFPFQIYSIQHLFAVVAAVLSVAGDQARSER